MKQKFVGLIISAIIIITIAVAILQLSSQGPLSNQPITAAAIGPNWQLDETQETENGMHYTYKNGEEKLIIRIREFESAREANMLYLNTFSSDNIIEPQITGFGENGFVGVYFNEFRGVGPWLLLITQDGAKYTELAYMNNNGKSYSSTHLDEDIEWIKELASQI